MRPPCQKAKHFAASRSCECKICASAALLLDLGFVLFHFIRRFWNHTLTCDKTTARDKNCAYATKLTHLSLGEVERHSDLVAPQPRQVI